MLLASAARSEEESRAWAATALRRVLGFGNLGFRGLGFRGLGLDLAFGALLRILKVASTE